MKPTKPTLCLAAAFLSLGISACVGGASGQSDGDDTAADASDDDVLPDDPSGSDGGEASGADGGAATADSGSPADGGSAADGGSLPAEKRIIGYYTAWSVYGRNYHVPDIPADKLTHINYAFANISADGECVLGDPYADIDKFYEGDSWDPGVLRGSFNQLIKLKQQHPNLRTLISVGGWTWSGRFSDVALDTTSRERFASSCVAFMQQYGFDGIDIDWEYPVGGGLAGNTTRPEDKHNYTLLLGELRSRLAALSATTGEDYLLTIAAPAGPGIMANLEIADLAGVVDWINVMTYDFHGSWSPFTNFNAPLYASSTDPSTDPDVRERLNASSATQAYVEAGAPSNKVVLGVPFYGRGWAGVADQNHGLYQSFSSLPVGTWEAGVFDYADLEVNYLPTYQRYVHAEAQVPWLYSPQAGVMISYDDPESLTRKAQYVLQHGLGGVMFWELSADTSDSALLDAIGDALAD